MRQELAARNLSSKGLKSQLTARLAKAIKSEQAKEEGRQDEVEENEKEASPPPKEDSKDEKKAKDTKEVIRSSSTSSIYTRILCQSAGSVSGKKSHRKKFYSTTMTRRKSWNANVLCWKNATRFLNLRTSLSIPRGLRRVESSTAP